ncbi:MAG: hypothetical protein ACPG4N_10355 [Gammaproteobacteria bacterium]
MTKKKKSRSVGPGRSHAHMDRRRSQVAELAARIMLESGIRDFAVAKSKAAERMGVIDGLPSNADIERALIEYQGLFRADSHQNELQQLRATALEAMRFFQSFSPLLTGAVLSGSAGPHAVIELHVFADAAESLAVYLDDQRLPYEIDEKRFRDGRGGYQYYPMLKFLADDTPIEVVVFPTAGRRQSPPSLVDGKPMARADVAQLERMITDSELSLID